MVATLPCVIHRLLLLTFGFYQVIATCPLYPPGLVFLYRGVEGSEAGLRPPALVTPLTS